MSRPLVWVGTAYALGEGLAAAGAGGAAIIMIIITFAAAVFTGRRHFQAVQCRFMCVLPVFLIIGYCMYLYCVFPRGNGLCEYGEETVYFSGKVCRVSEKENSIALILERAQLEKAPYADGNGSSDGKTEQADGIVSDDGKAEQADGVRASDEGTITAGCIIYADKDEAAQIEEGWVISGSGTLNEPQGASDPGQFDMKTWYLSQGIRYTLMPDSIRIIERKVSFRTVLGRLRRMLSDVFGGLFDEDVAGILDAMILGDRLLLDKDIREYFRIMGISHVLAISGLHISLIGRGLYSLIRKAGAGFRASSLVSAFAVLSYGVLSGMSASTSRAVIMFLVYMGAEYTGRTYDMMSALSLSALIIFIRQPLMITQSGVQFSFLAITGLGVAWPAVSYMLPEKIKRSQLMFRAGPAAAVTAVTLPLTSFYYGEIPLLSLPVNLLIIPCMSLLVPLGALTGITGLISLNIAAFPGGSVNAVLKFTVFLCERASKLPFAVLRTGVPPAWIIIIYYTGLAFLCAMAYGSRYKAQIYAEKHVRLIKNEHDGTAAEISGVGRGKEGLYDGTGRMSVLAGKLFWMIYLVLLILLMIPFRRSENVFLFMDVGQGDGTFIRHGGVSWLIDGGSSDTDKAGEYRILPVMKYYGEYAIDYAMVSHGDEDHISGVRELLEMKRIKHLVLTYAGRENENLNELAALAMENGADVIYVSAGDRWSDGGYDFRCLYPAQDCIFTDTNDQSMVFRLDTGEVSILFTGDISSDGEQEIMKMYKDDKSVPGSIDILKCPHHGSRYSSSENFLAWVDPELTVISCGRNNRYGHPSPQTVKRLLESGSDVLCTADCGCISLAESGDGITAETPYAEDR